MVRWSKLSGVDKKTLVDVLDPGHLEEFREEESRQLRRLPRQVKKAVRKKRRVKDVTKLLEQAKILKPEFVKGLVGLLSPENAANSTVSGRGSPLRETSNVGPAAFTQEGEVPPDHPGDKELTLYQPLPFAVAFEYTAGVDGGESGDGGSPYPKGGGELTLYQPLPFGMIVQDTAGVDGGESGDGGSPYPKGGGELMLYQPLPFGMIVQDTEGVDGGESRDGGSARAVVPDAIGTSAWVPEGPPSHMAVVASDDGAEGELHSLREVSLPLVRWSDRRITEPPHPAMVGVVSALFTAAVFLCCQWRSRRTRLRQQALALARQHALRRVIRRNADRSRQLKVSAIWRWRLSAASGAVADLRAQRERTAEEHEAARATDREAAEQ
ncbi:unnamed protein product, partial [Ectocarpus fasciculatus]